jgi:tetratricopeptide (TPR) repeat protein
VTTPPQDYLPAILSRLQAADPTSGRRLLEESVLAHPTDPRLLLLLAAELVHAKELDRAEAAYTAALNLAPDFAIARFQLGLLQFTSARPAVAMATWSLLERLDEKHPLRLFKTGLEALGQDQFAEARKWLEAGIAQNHENPALNRDMRLVLERIAGLGADAAPGAQEPASDSGQGHVLISSYKTDA